MSNKFLKKENLSKLIDALMSEGSIFVAPTNPPNPPLLKGGQGGIGVVYAPVAKFEEIVFDYIIPRNSFKEFLFPQTEPIAAFTIGKDGVDMKGVEVNPKETVIFGSRPCDAASVASLRAVFNWDFKDEFSHQPSAISHQPIADIKPLQGIDVKKIKEYLKDTKHYENPLWAELA